MFLLKETLPNKVARKYSRLQQIDEEQGVAPEPADTDNKGSPVTCCMASDLLCVTLTSLGCCFVSCLCRAVAWCAIVCYAG